MNNELLLLISFSGGRTSAFMAKYLMERYCNRQKVVVFANTGNFRKATDEHETNKQQMTMFDAELDIEYDCFCKST